MNDFNASSELAARQVSGTDEIYQQRQLGFYDSDLPGLPDSVKSDADSVTLGRLILPTVEIEGEVFNFRAAAEIRNDKFADLAHGVIRGGFRFNALESGEVESLIGPEATLVWHPWQALARAQLLHARTQAVLDNTELPKHIKLHVSALSHSQATEGYILSLFHDEGELIYGDTALRNKTPEHERKVFEASVGLVNKMFGYSEGWFPVLPYEFIEKALRHDVDDNTIIGQTFKVNERLGYLGDGMESLRSSHSRSVLPNDSLVQSALVEFGLESVSREVEKFSSFDLLLSHPIIFDVMHDNADEIEKRLGTYTEDEVAGAIEESVRSVADFGLLPEGATVDGEIERIKILAARAGRIIVQDPAYRLYPSWEEFALAVA